MQDIYRIENNTSEMPEKSRWLASKYKDVVEKRGGKAKRSSRPLKFSGTSLVPLPRPVGRFLD